MRSLVKAPLRQDEETYRLLVTMVKKLKMSKKEERLIYLEAVTDLVWLTRILPYSPVKYSVILSNEEVAKIITYLKDGILHLHDIYVIPKYRKQKLAKALIIEAISDYREIPKLSFYTRESNKPIHNLVSFFIQAYNLSESEVVIHKVEHFYIDGGNAVIYTMTNPAYSLKESMREANDKVLESQPS